MQFKYLPWSAFRASTYKNAGFANYAKCTTQCPCIKLPSFVAVNPRMLENHPITPQSVLELTCLERSPHFTQGSKVSLIMTCIKMWLSHPIHLNSKLEPLNWKFVNVAKGSLQTPVWIMPTFRLFSLNGNHLQSISFPRFYSGSKRNIYAIFHKSDPFYIYM